MNLQCRELLDSGFDLVSVALVGAIHDVEEASRLPESSLLPGFHLCPPDKGSRGGFCLGAVWVT